MENPKYIWVCHKCGISNQPETATCSSCGFPANANMYEIEAAVNHTPLPNYIMYPERIRNIVFIACNVTLAFTYLVIACSTIDLKNYKIESLTAVAVGAMFYVPLFAGSYALATVKNFNLLRISNYLFILMLVLMLWTVFVTYIGWNIAGVFYGQFSLILCIVLGLNGISLASRHGKISKTTFGG